MSVHSYTNCNSLNESNAMTVFNKTDFRRGFGGIWRWRCLSLECVWLVFSTQVGVGFVFCILEGVGLVFSTLGGGDCV